METCQQIMKQLVPAGRNIVLLSYIAGTQPCPVSFSEQILAAAPSIREQLTSQKREIETRLRSWRGDKPSR